jgi:hypothetical protein
VEEHGAAFSFAQAQEEEHQDHIRLRQEQDVAYQIGLQADQVRNSIFPFSITSFKIAVRRIFLHCK